MIHGIGKHELSGILPERICKIILRLYIFRTIVIQYVAGIFYEYINSKNIPDRRTFSRYSYV